MIEHKANGEIFQGKYKNGARKGLGKLTLSNGDCYNGDFLDDQYSCCGTYHW